MVDSLEASEALCPVNTASSPIYFCRVGLCPVVMAMSESQGYHPSRKFEALCVLFASPSQTMELEVRGCRLGSIVSQRSQAFELLCACSLSLLV